MYAHPDEVATRALDYLESHHCMSIATDGPEGLWAATVFYVNEGFTLYFLSLSDDADAWPEIHGVQLEGMVARVGSRDDYLRVIARFGERFPFADTLWWSDAPRDPHAEQRLYRLDPTRVLFVDHAFRSARSAIATEQLRR